MNKFNIFKESEILCLFFDSTQKYLMHCESKFTLTIFSLLQYWIAPSFSCFICTSSKNKIILLFEMILKITFVTVINWFI